MNTTASHQGTSFSATVAPNIVNANLAWRWVEPAGLSASSSRSMVQQPGLVENPDSLDALDGGIVQIRGSVVAEQGNVGKNGEQPVLRLVLENIASKVAYDGDLGVGFNAKISLSTNGQNQGPEEAVFMLVKRRGDKDGKDSMVSADYAAPRFDHEEADNSPELTWVDTAFIRVVNLSATDMSEGFFLDLLTEPVKVAAIGPCWAENNILIRDVMTKGGIRHYVNQRDASTVQETALLRVLEAKVSVAVKGWKILRFVGTAISAVATKDYFNPMSVNAYRSIVRAELAAQDGLSSPVVVDLDVTPFFELLSGELMLGNSNDSAVFVREVYRGRVLRQAEGRPGRHRRYLMKDPNAVKAMYETDQVALKIVSIDSSHANDRACSEAPISAPSLSAVVNFRREHHFVHLLQCKLRKRLADALLVEASDAHVLSVLEDILKGVLKLTSEPTIRKVLDSLLRKLLSDFCPNYPLIINLLDQDMLRSVAPSTLKRCYEAVLKRILLKISAISCRTTLHGVLEDLLNLTSRNVARIILEKMPLVCPVHDETSLNIILSHLFVDSGARNMLGNNIQRRMKDFDNALDLLLGELQEAPQGAVAEIQSILVKHVCGQSDISSDIEQDNIMEHTPCEFGGSDRAQEEIMERIFLSASPNVLIRVTEAVLRIDVPGSIPRIQKEHKAIGEWMVMVFRDVLCEQPIEHKVHSSSIDLTSIHVMVYFLLSFMIRCSTVDMLVKCLAFEMSLHRGRSITESSLPVEVLVSILTADMAKFVLNLSDARLRNIIVTALGDVPANPSHWLILFLRDSLRKQSCFAWLRNLFKAVCVSVTTLIDVTENFVLDSGFSAAMLASWVSTKAQILEFSELDPRFITLPYQSPLFQDTATRPLELALRKLFANYLLGASSNTIIAVMTDFLQLSIQDCDIDDKLVEAPLCDLKSALLAVRSFPLGTEMLQFPSHDRGALFLVMPFFNKCSLQDAIFGKRISDQSATIRTDLARYIIYDVAKGLEFMHSNSIAHLDISVENVLIDDHCHCVLSDFGEAKASGGESFRVLSVARKPPYCDPMFLNAYIADLRSDEEHSVTHYRCIEDLLRLDAWCLGILLFLLLWRSDPLTFTQEQMNREKNPVPIFIREGEVPELSWLTRWIDNKTVLLDRLAMYKFAKPVMSLLRQLLETAPTKRPTMTEVLDHEWFQDMDHSQATREQLFGADSKKRANETSFATHGSTKTSRSSNE